MSRKTFSLFVIFAIVCFVAKAQEVYHMRGYVFDSLTMKPLANVEIMCENSTKLFTDVNGYFSFYSLSPVCNAELHCISYDTVTVELNCSAPATIFLYHISYKLNAVDISANLPRDLLSGKSYQVMDYEFLGDKIILMVYERQSIFLPKLLLIDREGDTLSDMDVHKPVRLDRDYDGKVYYVSKLTSYEISADSDQIRLINPVNTEDFENLKSSIVDHNGYYYYLRQYLFNNLMLNYYNYDEVNDSLFCFRTITDMDMIRRNRWGVYFDGKEEDIRFQQLIMNRPVNAPLLKLGDTMMVFNFIESKIEKYNLKSDILEQIGIDFHQNRNFSGQLYVDPVRLKVYTLFMSNGIARIKEISTTSGDVLKTADVPRFVFIENIKIHDGILYFLYKSKDLSEYKKLYAMKI